MGATTTAVEYLSAEIVATPSGGSGTRYVVGGWNSKPSGDNAYASSGGSVTIQLAANEVVTLGYEISDAITLQGYSFRVSVGELKRTKLQSNIINKIYFKKAWILNKFMISQETSELTRLLEVKQLS